MADRLFLRGFPFGLEYHVSVANGAAIYGSNNLFSYFSPMPILQQSVFGEVTYNVTEPFAVTVGLRRYHYDAPVRLNQSVRSPRRGGLTRRRTRA